MEPEEAFKSALRPEIVQIMREKVAVAHIDSRGRLKTDLEMCFDILILEDVLLPAVRPRT